MHSPYIQSLNKMSHRICIFGWTIPAIIRGIVHPKMQILSFTHSDIVPNPKDFE